MSASSPVRKKSKVHAEAGHAEEESPGHAEEESPGHAEEKPAEEPPARPEFDILVPNIATFVKICKAITDSVDDFFVFTFTGREILLKQMGPGRATLLKFRYPCESEGEKELLEEQSRAPPIFVVKSKFLTVLNNAIDMCPDEVRFRTKLDGIEIRSISEAGGSNDFVRAVCQEPDDVMGDLEYTRTVTIGKTSWMSMCRKAKDANEMTIMLTEKDQNDYIVFKTDDNSNTVFACGEKKDEQRKSARERAKQMEALIDYPWEKEEEVNYRGLFDPGLIDRLLKHLTGKISCHFPSIEGAPIMFTYNWGIRGCQFKYFVGEKVNTTDDLYEEED